MKTTVFSLHCGQRIAVCTGEAYISVGELGHNWLRWWLVPCSAPMDCQNQYWLIAIPTSRNNFRKLRQIVKVFNQGNAFENVVCKRFRPLKWPDVQYVPITKYMRISLHRYRNPAQRMYVEQDSDTDINDQGRTGGNKVEISSSGRN